MNSLVLNTDSSQLKASVIVENPINIKNEVLTVEGVVSIENPITVKDPITIGNQSLNVINVGNSFVSDKVSLTDISGEGYFFEGKDISNLRTATIFLDNVGLDEVTVSLELSPDGVTYFEDIHYTDISIEPSKKVTIIINTFAQFIRLKYNVSDNSTTLNAYYNAQY